jgi:hypothetical protein
LPRGFFYHQGTKPLAESRLSETKAQRKNKRKEEFGVLVP